MVQCINCKWALKITPKLRWDLSQENKEILNILEDRGYDLDEFRYCMRLGYIESKIIERSCLEWKHSEP
jgi:hypothetical protein